MNSKPGFALLDTSVSLKYLRQKYLRWRWRRTRFIRRQRRRRKWRERWRSRWSCLVNWRRGQAARPGRFGRVTRRRQIGELGVADRRHFVVRGRLEGRHHHLLVQLGLGRWRERGRARALVPWKWWSLDAFGRRHSRRRRRVDAGQRNVSRRGRRQRRNVASKLRRGRHFDVRSRLDVVSVGRQQTVKSYPFLSP